MGLRGNETIFRPALVHSAHLLEYQSHHCTGYSQALITSNAVQISRPVSGLGG